MDIIDHDTVLSELLHNDCPTTEAMNKHQLDIVLRYQERLNQSYAAQGKLEARLSIADEIHKDALETIVQYEKRQEALNAELAGILARLRIAETLLKTRNAEIRVLEQQLVQVVLMAGYVESAQRIHLPCGLPASEGSICSSSQVIGINLLPIFLQALWSRFVAASSHKKKISPVFDSYPCRHITNRDPTDVLEDTQVGSEDESGSTKLSVTDEVSSTLIDIRGIAKGRKPKELQVPCVTANATWKIERGLAAPVLGSTESSIIKSGGLEKNDIRSHFDPDSQWTELSNDEAHVKQIDGPYTSGKNVVDADQSKAMADTLQQMKQQGERDHEEAHQSSETIEVVSDEPSLAVGKGVAADLVDNHTQNPNASATPLGYYSFQSSSTANGLECGSIILGPSNNLSHDHLSPFPSQSGFLNFSTRITTVKNSSFVTPATMVAEPDNPYGSGIFDFSCTRYRRRIQTGQTGQTGQNLHVPQISPRIQQHIPPLANQVDSAQLLQLQNTISDMKSRSKPGFFSIVNPNGIYTTSTGPTPRITGNRVLGLNLDDDIRAMIIKPRGEWKDDGGSPVDFAGLVDRMAELSFSLKSERVMN